MNHGIRISALVLVGLGVSAAAGCGGDDADGRQSDGGGEVDADAAMVPLDPGDVAWSVPHRLPSQYAAAIAPDGTIIVHGQPDGDPGTDDPSVLAISPAGELRWTASTVVGAISAPPASVVGEVVYLPAADLGADSGTLYGFALGDGAPAATRPVEGPVTSGLAVAADETLYVAATPLMAFGVASWSFAMNESGKTGSNPAVGPSGTIYVAARGLNDHNLYAVTPAGVEAWRRDVGGAVISPIAIDAAERIYLVNGDGLLAVHEASGDPAWSFQLPSFTSGGGIVLGPDGTVYVGTLADDPINFDGEWMFAVRETEGGEGELVWRAAVGHGVITTPALSAAGTLYVTDLCRKLTALDAVTGEERWSFAEPNTPEGMCSGFSAPALAADGMVYVSTEGYDGAAGGTYAIIGDRSGPAASPWPVESGDPAHLGRVSP